MQSAVLCVCGLLALGFLLRAIVRPLQWLFVPAAVTGGLVGLMAAQAVALLHRRAQAAPETGGDGQAYVVLDQLHAWQEGVVAHLADWPGALIAVIFAGLLLEKPARSARESTRSVSVQALMVWIIILGQVALGLTAVWLFVLPRHPEVPPSFGQLIEVGFAGGHGTATAMGDVFSQLLGFPEGKDLGFLFATAGLVVGVATGMLYVNIAVRRGWTHGAVALKPTTGLEARRNPTPVALGRVGAEVIDPLLFQGIILASAFVVGLGIQAAFMTLGDQILALFGASSSPRHDVMKFVGKMPLFMFTLLGGLAVRRVLAIIRLGDLVDPQGLRRITGAAMELLIVAAISSMRIEVIGTYFTSIVVLLVIGFAWSGFCLLVLARRLLPGTHWFELGVINYGMSTGTTAQGMMLLRIVDGDLKTSATEDYAMAAPLSAPFIGGGVLTLVGVPALLNTAPIGLVAAGLAVVVVLLYGVARRLGAPWRAVPPA